MFSKGLFVPALCAVACLSLASCVQSGSQYQAPPQMQFQPQPEVKQPIERGALSGTRQQIAEFYFVNPDCSTNGTPTLKMAKAPQHGTIEVVQGTAFADFAKTSTEGACNGKKVPATLIFYTSEPGFIGADSVAFERIGVAGAYGYHDYTINVR